MFHLKNGVGEVVGASAFAINRTSTGFAALDRQWLMPADVADACVVEDVPDAPSLPAEVPRRNAMRAIYDKLTKTQADLEAMAGAVQDEDLRARMLIDIRDSRTFRRSNSTLAALAGVLGLDAAAVDDLFVYANSIGD